MNHSDAIRTTVYRIIAEQLDVPPTFAADATLEALGADSLDRVEIIMRLEEEFSIQMDDDTAANLCSVEQVVEYVEKLVAEHSA
jgi:acyl carrier protein